MFNKWTQDILIEQIRDTLKEAQEKNYPEFILQQDFKKILGEYEEALYESWGQEDIDSLKDKISDLEADLEEAEDEKDDLEERLTEAEDHIDELAEELEQAKERIVELEAALD